MLPFKPSLPSLTLRTQHPQFEPRCGGSTFLWKVEFWFVDGVINFVLWGVPEGQQWYWCLVFLQSYLRAERTCPSQQIYWILWGYFSSVFETNSTKAPGTSAIVSPLTRRRKAGLNQPSASLIRSLSGQSCFECVGEFLLKPHFCGTWRVSHLLEVLVTVDVLLVMGVLQLIGLHILPEGLDDAGASLSVNAKQAGQARVQLKLGRLRRQHHSTLYISPTTSLSNFTGLVWNALECARASCRLSPQQPISWHTFPTDESERWRGALTW